MRQQQHTHTNTTHSMCTYINNSNIRYGSIGIGPSAEAMLRYITLLLLVVLCRVHYSHTHMQQAEWFHTALMNVLAALVFVVIIVVHICRSFFFSNFTNRPSPDLYVSAVCVCYMHARPHGRRLTN